MARPVSAESDDVRQLNIVLDLKRDDGGGEESAENWLRRHSVLPKSKKNATADNEQAPKSEWTALLRASAYITRPAT